MKKLLVGGLLIGYGVACSYLGFEAAKKVAKERLIELRPVLANVISDIVIKYETEHMTKDELMAYAQQEFEFLELITH